MPALSRHQEIIRLLSALQACLPAATHKDRNSILPRLRLTFQCHILRRIHSSTVVAGQTLELGHLVVKQTRIKGSRACLINFRKLRFGPLIFI